MDFASNNTLMNNIIMAGGSGSTNYGVFLQSAGNNTFSNNNFTTVGSTSYAIRLGTSNGTLFNNTFLYAPAQWIFIGDAQSNTTFQNTTFFTPNVSVRMQGSITTNTSYDVTRNKLNMSFNHAFLNATNLSFMNTSANITFYGIDFLDPQVTVAAADGGGFEPCAAGVCDEIDYAGGTFTFNVAHWTNYSSNETPTNACGTLTTSRTLAQDFNSSGDCFTITASNVVVDCVGFEINYSQAFTGHAFVARGVNNITIRNCNLVNNYDVVNNSHAINFTNVNNSYVIDNNITVDSNKSVGVYLNSANNNTVANNSINTTGIGDNKYGIQLTSGAHNNTVSDNVIRTQGTGDTNAGVWMEIVASGNVINGNDIRTNGTSNNYGIVLSTNVDNSTIINNVVQTQGTGGSNLALYLVSTTRKNYI
ncbi:MAG: right-handed parallel beta-helix repeat-containing protein, partial [Nanoarchaeota archaeon]